MIVVTGASGQLGRLVVEELLKQRPAAEIVAAVRNPERVKDFAARGVQVRHADYEKPETLAAYRSAVSANPYYWSNHNTLGAYFEFGDTEKALQEYRKVSELAPDNPIGYQNTGPSISAWERSQA